MKKILLFLVAIFCISVGQFTLAAGIWDYECIDGNGDVYACYIECCAGNTDVNDPSNYSFLVDCAHECLCTHFPEWGIPNDAPCANAPTMNFN